MNTENIYSVYVHKNLKNDKYYVGCTKQNPSYRWNNGKGYKNNTQMWKDIQESNWNSDWLHGILGKFENEQDALKYEAFLIAMLDSVRNGYNTSSYDSHHCKHSEETKRKMSEAKTGRVFTEEHRKRLSESKGINGILQYSIDGEFIAEYPSLMEASRHNKCNPSNICQCCKEKRKSTGGYVWKYKEGI